ncbi:hypothetical protein [Aliivibrio finisterrensis]|uniref:Uncharacterized protein n=1 Tax=Aliivibrio finisterrensis TaxID=511998 RepID=A0ABY0I298_9GAMM|nr:hypothetical protein [Aliivibrio finisterrensis]RYU59571.1 hypothetical protein ERW53_19960 [Aliivibrio finisterrensis]RYU79002.1 hypothetical protein ERW52_19950 [Aliivibrio finisterrensis]
MTKYFMILVIAGVMSWITYPEITAIKYGDYKDLIVALLNVSSIIFAIIGAWIAIIYPKAIGKTFGNNLKSNEFYAHLNENKGDSNYLSELVEIVLVSAVVLICVLIIQFLYPVVRGMGFFGLNVSILKSTGFFILATLTICQLHAVFRVILANYFFLNQLRKKNVDDEIDRLHK